MTKTAPSWPRRLAKCRCRDAVPDMSFRLRDPVATDYSVLASWIPDATACARWAGASFQFPFVPAELPALLHLKQEHSYSMVAANDALRAFGQFSVKDGRTAHLGRIIVAPAERGRGMGRILLELLIREARRSVAPEFITLRVYRDNAPARTLYAGLGFTEVEAESDANVLAMRLTTN